MYIVPVRILYTGHDCVCVCVCVCVCMYMRVERGVWGGGGGRGEDTYIESVIRIALF